MWSTWCFFSSALKCCFSKRHEKPNDPIQWLKLIFHFNCWKWPLTFSKWTIRIRWFLLLAKQLKCFFAYVLNMCFFVRFSVDFEKFIQNVCAIYRITIFLKRQWIMWHIAMLDDTVPFVVIKIPTNKLEMCLEFHKTSWRKKAHRNDKSTKLDRRNSHIFVVRYWNWSSNVIW